MNCLPINESFDIKSQAKIIENYCDILFTNTNKYIINNINQIDNCLTAYCNICNFTEIFNLLKSSLSVNTKFYAINSLTALITNNYFSIDRNILFEILDYLFSLLVKKHINLERIKRKTAFRV